MTVTSWFATVCSEAFNKLEQVNLLRQPCWPCFKRVYTAIQTDTRIVFLFQSRCSGFSFTALRSFVIRPTFSNWVVAWLNRVVFYIQINTIHDVENTNRIENHNLQILHNKWLMRELLLLLLLGYYLFSTQLYLNLNATFHEYFK